MAVEGRSRSTWTEVDLEAIRHNVAQMLRISSPAALCAVVKADAYGHGAPGVASAAIEGGAAGLAVALVDEGIELREAGITQPVLLLSEPPLDAADAVVAGGLTPTLATVGSVAPLAAAARRLGVRLSVHVKVDTGMHRVGASVTEVPSLVAAVAEEPMLRLEGLWTHLAVAGEDKEFTALQLRRFDGVVAALAAAGIRPTLLHVANSAGAITCPEARYDLVRCGITIYGELPAGAAGAMAPDVLQPALSLRSKVSAVRELEAGERPSYGRLRPLPERSLVATVPIGYADGVPRALFNAGFSVLIGGRRRPLAGMVTMDQIVVDCGPGADVALGDEVVLIGRQGDDAITVSEWAGLMGTIGYEVLCGIGPRVPRVEKGSAP